MSFGIRSLGMRERQNTFKIEKNQEKTLVLNLLYSQVSRGYTFRIHV